MPHRYIEQRARAAYIASTCQPEATFDMSIAAQQQKPERHDVVAINKRIKWQIQNMDRGLVSIPLDLMLWMTHYYHVTQYGSHDHMCITM